MEAFACRNEAGSEFVIQVVPELLAEVALSQGQVAIQIVIPLVHRLSVTGKCPFHVVGVRGREPRIELPHPVETAIENAAQILEERLRSLYLRFGQASSVLLAPGAALKLISEEAADDRGEGEPNNKEKKLIGQARLTLGSWGQTPASVNRVRAVAISHQASGRRAALLRWVWVTTGTGWRQTLTEDDVVLHQAAPRSVPDRILAPVWHGSRMPTDQYHEPPAELGDDARTFARVIVSLQEEAEAIGWYEQRMAVETNGEALQKILFSDGDIVELAEQGRRRRRGLVNGPRRAGGRAGR